METDADSPENAGKSRRGFLKASYSFMGRTVATCKEDG
jgi:hypothetical protein